MSSNWDYQCAIIEREDLTGPETCVALVLLWHRNTKTGLCYPSITTLARESGYSVRTVSRALDGLRQKGVVESEQATGAANHYRFEADPCQYDRGTSANMAYKPLINHLGGDLPADQIVPGDMTYEEQLAAEAIEQHFGIKGRKGGKNNG